MQINVTPRNVGLAGAAIMAIGVFAPILSVPVLGNLNYIQNGQGDGVCILAAAIGGAWASYLASRKGTATAGGVAAVIMVLTYVGIQARLDQLRNSMQTEAGGILSGLGNAVAMSVQMQWGWLLLILGAALLLFAGFNLPQSTTFHDGIETAKERREDVGLGLAVGVGVLPLLVGWSVLAGNYRKTDRIKAAVWMGFGMIFAVGITMLLATPTSNTTEPPQSQAAATASVTNQGEAAPFSPNDKALTPQPQVDVGSPTGLTTAEKRVGVADVRVTSIDLAQAYARNPLEAASRYSGKKLLVTGAVSNVSPDTTEGIAIILDGPTASDRVGIVLDLSYSGLANTLHVGTAVSFRCDNVDNSEGFPLLTQCAM